MATRPPIDTSAYGPLLQTIAKGESNGNYNAYFGNASNDSVLFTNMTVAQVLEWQAEQTRKGSISNAVGKYQIIRPTLLGLIKERHANEDDIFSPETQDTLARALIDRRGAQDYAADKLSQEQFAANLAREWAAFPRVIGNNPTESYYASDGINKARISVEEVFKAISVIKTQ